MSLWIEIENFPGYQVSANGTVRRKLRRAKVVGREFDYLKPWRRKGYLVVRLYQRDGSFRDRTIHSLVLEAFHGRRPLGQLSRHMDGNKENNAKENLAWGSASDNYEDSRKHGTAAIGERNGRHLHGDRLVRAIRQASGTTRQIAARYGVSNGYVSLVKNRKRRASA